MRSANRCVDRRGGVCHIRRALLASHDLSGDAVPCAVFLFRCLLFGDLHGAGAAAVGAPARGRDGVRRPSTGCTGCTGISESRRAAAVHRSLRDRPGRARGKRQCERSEPHPSKEVRRRPRTHEAVGADEEKGAPHRSLRADRDDRPYLADRCYAESARSPTTVGSRPIGSWGCFSRSPRCMSSCQLIEVEELALVSIPRRDALAAVARRTGGLPLQAAVPGEEGEASLHADGRQQARSARPKWRKFGPARRL